MNKILIILTFISLTHPILVRSQQEYYYRETYESYSYFKRENYYTPSRNYYSSYEEYYYSQYQFKRARENFNERRYISDSYFNHQFNDTYYYSKNLGEDLGIITNINEYYDPLCNCTYDPSIKTSEKVVPKTTPPKKNYDFLRCQLAPNDPASQVFFLELDLTGNPDNINFISNKHVREIEQPWMDAYEKTLTNPNDKIEYDKIMTQIGKSEKFSGDKYPPEFKTHFLLNGPMIDQSPAVNKDFLGTKITGLLIQDGKLISPLNLFKVGQYDSVHNHLCQGNFYEYPDQQFQNNSSGVIIIRKDGSIKYLTAMDAHFAIFRNYTEPMENIKLAFQGGPIMQQNGSINTRFRQQSTNLNPRVAACVTYEGKLRFISTNSTNGLNFYNTTVSSMTNKCYDPKTAVEIPIDQKKTCQFTIFLDGADGVVDANHIPSGLATIRDTGIRKNFFDITLTE